MFIWRNGGKDSWGNLIYIGYNLKGEKIFSESLEATFVFYCGDGVFILSKRNDYGREINAVFNSRGECLIPFSMGYNFIAYYPEMMCFWCSYKDASGSEIECHTYSADVRYYAVGEYSYLTDKYDATGFYDLSNKFKVPLFDKYKKRVSFDSPYTPSRYQRDPEPPSPNPPTPDPPSPNPPKREPVPVQVWKPCGMCGGSGTCYMCSGSGGYYFGANAKWMECTACHGLKRCTYCAGQGGHYEVEYR